jgi:spore coat protein U-like protein
MLGTTLLAALLVAGPTWSAQCSVTTSGLHFGSVSANAQRYERGLATLLVTCRGKIGERVNFRVRLTSGEGSFRERIMRSGTDALPYNLYLDANGLQVWGDGSQSTRELTGSVVLTGPLYSHSYPVYARLSSTTSVKAGPYSDTLLVQFDY